MRKNTGYINSFDVIDINKGAVSFNDIYKEDIVKKINNTYDLYYNKSMDSVPNSITNVTIIEGFLNRLNTNCNNIAPEENILNTDELIRLKKIYDLGVMTTPDISVTTVSIPIDVINDILDDISRFELIKDSLTDPDKRKFYFQVYSTSNEYTTGEANYDSLIITNSQNLEQMIDDITKTAEDLKNDDLLIYNNLASFPVIGVVGEVYLANDTKIKYEWNGSSYVVSTNTSYFAGANKLNLKLDRELNSKLSTIKADAIEFAVHVANLIKYLYYGIKNPSLGNEGATWTEYNNFKTYFNVKYPQFNINNFDRFNETPFDSVSMGKSFRKMLVGIYGGTYGMFQTFDPKIDYIKYYFKSFLYDLYTGSNSFKSNFSNVVNVGFKNVFKTISEQDKDIIYRQINVFLRIINITSPVSYYNRFRNPGTGEILYSTDSISPQSFQFNIITPAGSNISIGTQLTRDLYNTQYYSVLNSRPENYLISYNYSITNNILNSNLNPLIQGIWDYSYGDNANRKYGGSLNLKHKCNSLYSIMNSTFSGNEITRVNEFSYSDLLSAIMLRTSLLGKFSSLDAYSSLSSTDRTSFFNILNSLSIPTSFWGTIPITVDYNSNTLDNVKNYDVESAYELEFYGIIP